MRIVKMAMSLALVVTSMLAVGIARAEQFVAVHAFNADTEGVSPVGGLLLASDGNFYGVTNQGGANRGGTVYMMTPAGKITVLHSFADPSTPNDGLGPEGGLVEGPDGNLYGTTAVGGSHGEGTIFKITKAGALTILHSFRDGSVAGDGSWPEAAMIVGSDGNFYGTTTDADAGTTTYGTVFKITPGGVVTVLHNFLPTEAMQPTGLFQASDGDIYGVAMYGGATHGTVGSSDGLGSIFKITLGGAVSVIHNFIGTDGAKPRAALTQGNDGYLYGTTSQYGTVFKLATNGTGFVTLNTLASSQSRVCLSPLVLRPDGNFYGTTASPGSIFMMTPAGQLTTLYTFPSYSAVSGQVAFNANGTLFGTSGYQQSNTAGSIFALRFGPTHLVVSNPPSTVAGEPMPLAVWALDPYGSVQHSYSGSVHFRSNDLRASLPTDSQVVNGVGQFYATLNTQGSSKITATDTVKPTITGTSATIAVSPAPVLLRVTSPSSAYVGIPITLRVTAIDPYGRLAPVSNVTVTCRSNAPQTTLPADTQLAYGARDLTCTFNRTGTWKVSVYDTAGVLKPGTSVSISVTNEPLDYLVVTSWDNVEAGVPFPVTVQALGHSGHSTAAYTGTVHFESTDSSATLPADTVLHNGVGNFNATMVTPGTQTITIRDTINASLTSTTANIIVRVPTYVLIAAPHSVTKGTPFSFMVSVRDQYGDQVDYPYPLTFTCSDPHATLPGPTSAPNGVVTLNATLNSVGSFKITGAGSSLRSGTSSTITVNP